jgi:hypothetical protein
MYTSVRIHGDMNTWTLTETFSPVQLTGSAGPLALGVAGPLTGTMLLSARAAGITLVPRGGTPDPMGWIPGDGEMLQPHLYLPSATERAAGHDLYPLPTTVDTTELEDEITAAMAAGTRFTVQVGTPGQGGAVVLNGATLPFVVITLPIPER